VVHPFVSSMTCIHLPFPPNLLALAVTLGALGLGCGGADSEASGAGGGAAASSGTGGDSASSSTATSGSTTGGSGGAGGGSDPSCLESDELLATLEIGAAPYGIAVNDSHVFWATSGNGEIWRALKDGSDAVLLAAGQGAPWGIRLQGDSVYWVSHAIDGVLSKVPVTGGPVVPIAVAPAARDLVVSDAFIFWTREPDDVERVGLDGSDPKLLISANMLSNTMALDESAIYWVNIGDGQVNRALPDGTEEIHIAEGQAQPWGIEVDATHAYWTNSADGSVRRVLKLGGEVETLASGQTTPMGIAVDDTHVYWADNETGIVAKAPKAGGATTVLANCQHRPLKLAVDATHLYWTNATDDTVRRVPK
jgi:hypothetical protein